MKSILLLIFLTPYWTLQAKELAQSTEEKVPLLELFSSESCSSCPPADRWFSSQKTNPGLWKTFVPLVFHVDYWNHLNWIDDFSSSAQTERQRNIAKLWPYPQVYTPGIVYDGKEWRAWPTVTHVTPVPSKEKVGILKLSKNSSNYEVEFTPSKNESGKWNVHLALLGMNVTTSVKAGENSGRTLTHDFLVLEWQTKPAETKKDKAIQIIFEKLKSQSKAKSLAITAWIERAGIPIAVQSTGLFLPDQETENSPKK